MVVVFISLSHVSSMKWVFNFIFAYVLVKISSTKLIMYEARRFCYLLQNLMENFCFLTTQYDAKFGVWGTRNNSESGGSLFLVSFECL